MRVTIVAANTFEFDARQLRTARALAGDGHTVALVGFGEPGLSANEALDERIQLIRVNVDRTIASAFRPLPPAVRRVFCRLLGIDPGATALPPGSPSGLDRLRAPVRRIVEIASHTRRVGPWAAAVVAARPGTDVYHCKALIALPVIRAAARASGGRYVYDIADIHTEAARLARMPRWFRALVRRRERTWIAGAAGLTAVSDDVADEVVKRFHAPRPTVMLNTPAAWGPEDGLPEPTGRLRALIGIAEEQPLVLYQGGFSVDRGIEELVAAVSEPILAGREVSVAFIGYGRLRSWLDEQVARLPGRVHVIDAVPPADLLAYTVDADVGVVGQPPRTLNQRLNLSNKLFEYMQAGVPSIVAGGTAHCRLATRLGVGRCVEPWGSSTLAAAIAELVDMPAAGRGALRLHCRQAAMATYTWEHQQAGVVGLYREIARAAGA